MMTHHTALVIWLPEWPEVAIFRQKNLHILATFPPICKSFGLYFSPNCWSMGYSSVKIMILELFGYFWGHSLVALHLPFKRNTEKLFKQTRTLSFPQPALKDKAHPLRMSTVTSDLPSGWQWSLRWSIIRRWVASIVQLDSMNHEQCHFEIFIVYGLSKISLRDDNIHMLCSNNE